MERRQLTIGADLDNIVSDGAIEEKLINETGFSLDEARHEVELLVKSGEVNLKIADVNRLDSSELTKILEDYSAPEDEEPTSSSLRERLNLKLINTYLKVAGRSEKAARKAKNRWEKSQGLWKSGKRGKAIVLGGIAGVGALGFGAQAALASKMANATGLSADVLDVLPTVELGTSPTTPEATTPTTPDVSPLVDHVERTTGVDVADATTPTTTENDKIDVVGGITNFFGDAKDTITEALGVDEASAASQNNDRAVTESGLPDYNRNEQNSHDRMSTEGAFDGEDRGPKRLDDHVLAKIENNPALLAAVLEVHESGSMDANYSLGDVNEDIESYAIGGEHGVYSEKGEKALDTLERSWNNGEQGKLLSESQTNALLEKYVFINHGVDAGEYKNAIDNKMYDAGVFDYRPELGDQIYAKELGNGKTVYFKVNEERPERDCLNVLTLAPRPEEVFTPESSPGTTPVSTPPEYVGELTPDTPEPGTKQPKPEPTPEPKPEPTPEPKPEPTPEQGNKPKGTVGSDQEGPGREDIPDVGPGKPETQQEAEGQTDTQAQEQSDNASNGSTAEGATETNSDTEQSQASPGAQGQTANGNVGE